MHSTVHNLDFLGCWYNFKTGKGGNPIDAIIDTQNVSLSEAIQIASSITGLSPTTSQGNVSQEKPDEKILEKSSIERLKRTETAQELWHKSINVKHTLGEKYLIEHRKIPKTILSHLTFRFLPVGTTYKDWNSKAQWIILTLGEQPHVGAKVKFEAKK